MLWALNTGDSTAFSRLQGLAAGSLHLRLHNGFWDGPFDSFDRQKWTTKTSHYSHHTSEWFSHHYGRYYQYRELPELIHCKMFMTAAEPAAFTPQRSVTKALHGSSLWLKGWKHPTKNARASCLARKTYREKDLENNGLEKWSINS